LKRFNHITDNDNQAKKLAKSWGRVLANSLTLSRLLLVPVFILLHGKGAFLACFLIVLGIGLSDILDGFVARKWSSPAVYGAVLDAGVDFAVVFMLCLFYCISGSYPVFLMILMVFSFGLFVFSNVRNKVFVKSRFGKYTGAVLYAAITLSIAARAFFPNILKTADWVGVFLSISILTVSISENIIALSRRMN
jgi:phosphatidylglycerophosphate synthase